MSLSSRAVAVAASTGCPRLESAARGGWSDTQIAQRLEGETAIQPRLAFALGDMFERKATGDDVRLLELLGVQGAVVRLDGEAEEQEDAFHAALADPDVAVITQGVLPGLYGGWHRPDLMIRRRNAWRIGEVKVYLDRAGDTPTDIVQSAITQTAVSIVSARRIGLTVDDDIVLILADLRAEPTTRVVSARGEAELIEDLLARAPLHRQTTSPPPLADHIYSAACEGACALARVCREEAQKQPGIIWPGADTSLGIPHEELLQAATAGNAPAAIQAGWDAATG